MVLASHLAPDGRSFGSRRCVVAGLLGRQADWGRFGDAWSVAVSKAAGEVGVQHISHHGDGQKPRLDALLDLLRVSRIGVIIAVSGEGSPDSDVEERQLLPGNTIDPGLRCFQRCVEEAVRQSACLAEGERVCFLMDWNDPLASTALWRLEEFKDLSPVSARERLGTLGFESRLGFVPLQAASCLAGEYAASCSLPFHGSKPRGRFSQAAIAYLDF